jgi:hypothetical protein
MPNILDSAKAALAALPCPKLKQVVSVLGKVYSEPTSPEKSALVVEFMDKVGNLLGQAEMTYMAGEPPSTENMNEDKKRWTNMPSLFKQFPIIRIFLRDGKVAHVRFAALDFNSSVYLFQDHFTLTDRPPQSSPQYSNGQWVLYSFQNHVDNPDILMDYVPVEYAGQEIIVHVEEKAS